MNVLAPGRTTGRSRRRRPEAATQWQLMWWRFKKHHMALIGMSVLGLLVFLAAFAEIVSPVTPSTRNSNYLSGPPMGDPLLR